MRTTPLRRLFTFALVMMLSIAIKAQSTNEAVERALLDYIEGFYEGDSSKITRSISPEAVKYGYWRDAKAATYAGEPMSFQQMIDYANGVKKRNKPAPATAPKKVEVYDVQDQTASGKVTAWWGTDYVLLAKINDKWMIRMVLWQSPPKK